MKNWKAVLSLVLALCLLAALLAACSSGEGTADAGQGSTDSGSSTQNDAQTQDPADTGEDAGEDVGGEEVEIVDVEFWMRDTSGTAGDHLDRLEEALNRITEPEGIHINLTYMQFGDWKTKVQLAIGGGERIDLCGYCSMNTVVQMKANNMAMDITDYLTDYAPDALAMMEKYVGPYTYDGRIYGLPTYRCYVTNGYLAFNQDMLDELGLTEQVQQMDSWSDLETVLGAITDAYAGTGTYAITPWLGSLVASNKYYIHGDNFSDIEVVDFLSDSLGVIYTDSEGHVGLSQAQEAYKEACMMTKEWYDKGWVYPDGLYDSALINDEVVAGRAAVGELVTSEVGVEITKTKAFNAPALCVKLYDGIVTTNTLTSWGVGVPITAEEPEAACKLINMLYTDAEFLNLLINGEEGVDYKLVDGQVEQIENQYKLGQHCLGNAMMLTPLYGNGADYYARVEADNEAADCSPYLGFAIDTTDMDLVMSQISAVTDQYKCSLQCGGYTEEYYQEFLSKLEVAGVQDYLDAVQQQLNAWMAKQ